MSKQVTIINQTYSLPRGSVGTRKVEDPKQT